MLVLLIAGMLCASHADVRIPANVERLRDSIPTADDMDTLINYCKLIQAAYFYGQKFADKKLGLTEDDIAYYNALWEGVFNVAYYQTGISNTEFIAGARFGEGSHGTFPPSALYTIENPDPYFLYHMTREIGMINSQYFSRCNTCVDLSIAKINAYLKVMYLRERIPQLWPDPAVMKKLNTKADVEEFWLYLRCLFPDEQINPKAPPPDEVPIVCDTLVVRSYNDVFVRNPERKSHCNLETTYDTLGPVLVSGRDKKRGALYEATLIIKSPCTGWDTCRQYFAIRQK